MSLKAKIKRFLKGFPGEKKYWDERYKSGGNSGAGSYGALANYKAQFINAFLTSRKISSVIDLGCGDGNQLSLLLLENIQYTGVDISEVIIKKLKEDYKDRSNFQFLGYDAFMKKIERANLVLSMDVIFHIIDDRKFLKYLDVLFSSAEQYVIIYSSNASGKNKYHVKDRSFSEVIKKRYYEWQLIYTEKNPVIENAKDSNIDSRSHFFIYERLAR